MISLSLAYLSLCVTALTGMILFFGFTFRRHLTQAPDYPLLLVRGHIVFVAITFILFTWALIVALSQRGAFLAHSFESALFTFSYLFYLGTFVYGLMYHLRFNLRIAEHRARFLVSHWVLAIFTFILLSSSFAIYHAPQSAMEIQKGALQTAPVKMLHHNMREKFLTTHNVH